MNYFREGSGVEESVNGAHKIISLYRSFAPNSFEFVFRTNLKDEIVFANALFAKQLGFMARKAIKGHSASVFFENPNDYYTLKNQALMQSRVQAAKPVLKSLHGNTLVVLLNCSVSKQPDGEQVINWNAIDISTVVEFEENLKAKHDELQQVNDTMEKFLYSTSHDLRSPVSSILGLLNLIKLENRDRHLDEYVNKIESSASRLDSIMKDLLGFTKASSREVKVAKVLLHELVDRILMQFSTDPAYPHILFDIDLGVSEIDSDAQRMEIIFENLIRNAIQFYDPAKARSVIKISSELTQNQIAITILDNGIGIAKAHQSRIFDMFYKASDSSNGAGLGLYIVKESVTQLLGKVTVESEIGFGSLFKISIPVSQ